METLPVPVSKTPTEYEQKVLREIHRWKNPKVGWLGKTVDKVNRRLHGVTDLVRKVPGVDWTIDNVVSGLLRLTNEIMQDSVWREAIFKEYHTAGHDVQTLDDIRRLDLEAIDQALRGLDTKYRSVTAAQGAAAGFAGAAGVLPDVARRPTSGSTRAGSGPTLLVSRSTSSSASRSGAPRRIPRRIRSSRSIASRSADVYSCVAGASGEAGAASPGAVVESGAALSGAEGVGAAVGDSR